MTWEYYITHAFDENGEEIDLTKKLEKEEIVLGDNSAEDTIKRVLEEAKLLKYIF